MMAVLVEVFSHPMLCSMVYCCVVKYRGDVSSSRLEPTRLQTPTAVLRRTNHEPPLPHGQQKTEHMPEEEIRGDVKLQDQVWRQRTESYPEAQPQGIYTYIGLYENLLKRVQK